MRASSWASTTTRRARSVNRSNMRIAPEASWGPPRPERKGGYETTNPADSLRVPSGAPRQSAESEHVQTTTTRKRRVGAVSRPGGEKQRRLAVGQLAASYAERTSAETRPRSGTSKPLLRAQSRISLALGPSVLAAALRPRRGADPTLRP